LKKNQRAIILENLKLELGSRNNSIIGVIDFNMGNLFSIQNCLNRLGYKCIISNKKEVLKNCSHYILPGVGSYDKAIENIEKLKLNKFLDDQAFKNKRPFLGICLGMQIMLDYGYEGKKTKGLGWIQGEVISLKPKNGTKVPHVGWNQIELKPNKIFNKTPNNSFFYFDHSYICEPKLKENIIAKTFYGTKFSVGINHNNIFGFQFHPEKSYLTGLRLIKSFIEEC